MLKRQGSTFFTSSATSLQSYSPAVPSTVIAESSFIRYSLDGKEVTLVDVALDGSNKLLWVLTKATPPEMTLDLLQLKVWLAATFMLAIIIIVLSVCGNGKPA